jgi:predicted N-acetyltransferase YhbS
MDLYIRSVRDQDIAEMIELSLLAWLPIHTSFREILGDDIYKIIWPDWRVKKKKSIGGLSQKDNEIFTFVAEYDARVVGFVSYKLDSESKTGTVHYLAVHPDYQRKGIGTELNKFALNRMKKSGMKMATAETGGDVSHLPARKSYEKTGYIGLPLVRYFNKL